MASVRGGRYALSDRIGNGSYGEIYKATDTKKGRFVAVKLERLRCSTPQLAYEYSVYKEIGPAIGFPEVFWSGTEGTYQVMSMELLGPNLSDLLAFCGNRFSLKTVLLLAEQMLSRIEYFHSKHYVHRDIKPQNFLMGLGDKGSTVFMIDFGLSKKYWNLKSGQHIPFTKGNNLVGTARYASINNHLGYEQSRRDDVEAIGYVLLYLARGTVPWCGTREGKDQKKQSTAILEKKFYTSPEELTKGLPEEFATYIHYCHNLQFVDKPDYNYLRQLFRGLFERMGYTYDSLFDWTLIKIKQFEENLSDRGYLACYAAAQ